MNRAVPKFILLINKVQMEKRCGVHWKQTRQKKKFAENVIGWMDGLSMYTECTSETIQQNTMYHGYHRDTMVNNLLAYGTDGKVFFCGLNFLGSWHDGSIIATLMSFICNNSLNFSV